MKTVLKQYLKVVPVEYKTDFEKNSYFSNKAKLFGISLALLLVELLSFYVDYTVFRQIYLILYVRIVIIVICAINLWVLSKYKSIEDYSLFYKRIIHIITILFLLSGAALALLGQEMAHDITTYVIAVFGLALFITLEPLTILSIYLVVMVCFILLLPMFQTSPIIVGKHIINIVTMNVFSCFGAAVVYRLTLEGFLDHKALEQKNLELKRLNEELEKAAIYDKLTGIYNRNKADDVLNYEINRVIRYKGNLSVIMADIDRFKNVNDKYGHQTGDVVLKGIAGLLHTSVRKTDTVGRWGGEEFLIICPGTTKNKALELAENIRRKIETTELLVSEVVTCSFGVAAYSDGDNDIMLVDKADKAMYWAKNNGRNRVEG